MKALTMTAAIFLGMTLFFGGIPAQQPIMPQYSRRCKR